MSRTVVLACLCAFALPSAVLLRQAQAAEASAASMAELVFPGAIDPVDPPQDHLGDSISEAGSLDLPVQTLSILDGIVALPDLGIRASWSRLLSAPSLPPPPTTRRRLCWLQVFRD